MAAIILDDHPYSLDLFPFAEIRSVADIRVGILTIREKWELATGLKIGTSAEAGISQLSTAENLVPANLVPSYEWMELFQSGRGSLESVTDPDLVNTLNFPWDIFRLNDYAIRQDFEAITKNRKSAAIPSTVQVLNPSKIFIEPGARLTFCTLNASTGPIYIGKNAEVMEGCTIRGPFAACENSVVKMGTRIYGATTVGPNSIVGGELKNVVIFGNSNKGHDGYLGDSVLGEWCNLGAGSSNSNLKNNAGEVKVWNMAARNWLSAGNKCGLLMGDYSRSAINTSFNTGSVVGVCANIFGPGLVPKYVSSFSWGSESSANYSFDKAIEHISNWKKLKKQVLSKDEIQRLKHIFDALSGA
ncbi:MAG: glucose-1-phosphate thymidylyltransferase [Chitinophagaceae bacterium]|nr:MAG: glucose-1-phosphate thymidylyltransferase [Chitinophagaceae bacterium]